MFFWNSLAFSRIQQMLAIWSLVPLPFLKPAWTSGISWFTYYWSLAWRILSMTLLACEMSAIVWYFEHSLVLPFFGIGMKTDLFQSGGHCWVFQICWHAECSTFTASSFRTQNSSTGVPSPHKSHLSQWCLHYTSVPLRGGTRGSAASCMDLCNSTSPRVTHGQRVGTLQTSG